MLSISFFRRTKRPYAKRLSPELCRRAMLSVRVQDRARTALLHLAKERGMSASEYMSLLLNEHLNYVTRQRESFRGLVR